MTTHTVRRAADVSFDDHSPLAPGAEGFGYWSIISEDVSAVHTGFGLCRLEANGAIGAHVHSFEESVYIVAGDVELRTPGASVHLREGDYALIPLAVPHSWHGHGNPVTFAQMMAPMPRRAYGSDTFAVDALAPHALVPVDPRDPRMRDVGAIAPEHMDPVRQSQELLAVSASMRTALLVYSGITVKMMVDSDLGAVLSTMFMVQYESGGTAGAHDHPFEETFFILDGDVDATLGDQEYRLSPGDIAWAGAGCPHAFRANYGPVRWLETQAPQPPSRHSYRFARDWDYLRERLTASGGPPLHQPGGDGHEHPH